MSVDIRRHDMRDAQPSQISGDLQSDIKGCKPNTRKRGCCEFSVSLETIILALTVEEAQLRSTKTSEWRLAMWIRQRASAKTVSLLLLLLHLATALAAALLGRQYIPGFEH